ncbi:uncharacterized protein PFL1_06770 [Pseudozyma flocculosa PF-1]|uniref:Uncharacterized protein n=1 Tax=Pseudozyma flocculosa PF-1 TaxID=1277687 RepID=A0A061H0P7_9BASI|nr:uncharacterized protein PFL1_06770 [Pseudozyma flocculosa PF-1]EPQ25698.1 hypothetical protein PFL1_06770 [Pseudozyma flocculosa PF-1]
MNSVRSHPRPPFDLRCEASYIILRPGDTRPARSDALGADDTRLVDGQLPLRITASESTSLLPGAGASRAELDVAALSGLEEGVSAFLQQLDRELAASIHKHLVEPLGHVFCGPYIERKRQVEPWIDSLAMSLSKMLEMPGAAERPGPFLDRGHGSKPLRQDLASFFASRGKGSAVAIGTMSLDEDVADLLEFLQTSQELPDKEEALLGFGSSDCSDDDDEELWAEDIDCLLDTAASYQRAHRGVCQPGHTTLTSKLMAPGRRLGGQITHLACN